MSTIMVRRGCALAGLFVAAAALAACTPTDTGGSTTTSTTPASTTTTAPGSTTTTTTAPAGSTPTITDAEYAQSSVRLRFTGPTVPGGTTITNYQYDLSCNGGTSISLAGQFLGTTASPALASNTCPDGTASSYRLSAVLSDATHTAPSAWKTVDPLSAPTLTDVQYATSGLRLHFTAPTVAADEAVTNYVSTWTSPYSAWRAADSLVAPTLSGATITTVGATLTFSPPALGSDQTVTNYVYDLSCDGGATVQQAGSYVGGTASPANVGYHCANPAASWYRLSAEINGTWFSPYTAWRAATS
jgi:hypothetical protein